MSTLPPENTHRKWVFRTLLTGVFVSVVDASTIMVALPTLASHYGTDLPTTQWVVIGTMLTIAALLVPMGRLGDLIGRKTIYVSGFVIAALGGLLAAFSTTITLLISARIVTGLGAAMVQGNSMAIIASVFEDHERGRALGIQMGLVGFGSITGPALGGIIIESLGVQGLFGILAICAALMALAGQLVLRRRPTPKPSTERFDWLGAFSLAGVLVALLLTLTLGPKVGWLDVRLLLCGAAALILLLGFLYWEHRCPHPMVKLSLFRNAYFSFGTLGTVVTFMGSSAMRFLVPFHLQAILGLSPRLVGLALIPAAAVTIFAAPLAGRLADRRGPRLVANAGMLLGAAGIAALSRLELNSSLTVIIASTMLVALGLACFHAPNNTSILNASQRQDYGVTSAFINLARNSGNVTGVAVATAITTSVMASAGIPATLESSRLAPDSPALALFVEGANAAFGAVALLMLTVLIAIASWRWRRGTAF